MEPQTQESPAPPAVPMRPTVGRVVHYYPGPHEGIVRPSRAGEPLAAIVAAVHGPTMVNLAVFDANGLNHSRTSVELIPVGEPHPSDRSFCTWMSFQARVAAERAAEGKPNS